MRHPPIHIPTDVLDTERDLMRAERDLARDPTQRGRHDDAQRANGRAWDAWGQELRRQVRQTVREDAAGNVSRWDGEEP